MKYSKSENKSEIEFINNSINFYGKIYLVDKNNEYFNITFSNNQYSITPVLKEYIEPEIMIILPILKIVTIIMS